MGIVRTEIKQFARKQVAQLGSKHKIIILDEADSMTEGAQQALRRVMELYSNTTRFALACNFSEKLIDPIKSRCAVLRYSQLTEKDMLQRLVDVCKLENVNYVPEGLEAIIFSSNGDLRQSINNLQSTACSFDLVNADNVFKFCDRPHPDIIRSIIKFCTLRDIDNALKILFSLNKSGFNPLDIIKVMFRVLKTFDMNDLKKLEFIKHIGYTHMIMLTEAQTMLQLSGLIATLCSS